jgi:hypothetical protein
MSVVAGTPATSVQNNSIKNISWTNAVGGAFTGIITAGAGDINIGTITGNSIGDNTTTGSILLTNNGATVTHMGINIGSSGTTDCQNNKIGSITTLNTTPATYFAGFTGIYKSNVAGTTTISNNYIGGSIANSINASTVAAVTGQNLTGINCAGTGSCTINSNTIAFLTNATTSASAGLTGILYTGGTGSVSNNTIHDLKSDLQAQYSIAAAGYAYGITGIQVSAVNAAKTVSGNIIYNLVATKSNFGGIVVGINALGATTAVTGSTTNTISGNFIYGLSTTSGSANAMIIGIRFQQNLNVFSNNIISLSPTTNNKVYGFFEGVNTAFDATHTNSFYHNTVYIGGTTPTSSSVASYCFYQNVTTYTRTLKNNLFVNVRANGLTPATGAKHYAIGAQVTGLTSDNNDYYVSGSGAKSIVGNGAAVDKATLADWKTYSGNTAGHDLSSISADPVFQVAGGTSSQSYTPSLVSIVGASGTGVTTDYYGLITRSTSKPAMGAIEISLSTYLGKTENANIRIANTTKGISVELNGESAIELYSLNGLLIEKTKAYGIYNRSLKSGMYILSVNGKATKFVKL